MNEFEVFSGKKNVILVAPHAYPGDDETGSITRLIQQRLDCSAVINEVYRRPKRKEKPRCSKIHKVCNLNNIDEYKEIIPDVYDAFVGSIVQIKQEIIGNNDRPFIFYIHSGSISLFNNACKSIAETENERIDILIGSGRGTDQDGEDESLTATEEEVNRLINAFKDVNLNAFSTNSVHFSAGKPFNLNQLFRHARYCPDKRVASFHLEIGKSLLRDDRQSVEDVAKRLADTIGLFTGGVQVPEVKTVADEIVPSHGMETAATEVVVKPENAFPVHEEKADDNLVKEAHVRLAGIFFSHYKNALLEAGQYIIDSFYDGKIELARQKTPTKELSYTQLVKHLQEQQEDSPKKSWLFNAVNLVIQEHDFSSIQALGQLNTSQKLLLLPVSDPIQKQSLAEEAVVEHYTTRQLAEAIKKTKIPQKQTLATCIRKPERLFSQEYSHLYSTNALTAIKPKKLRTLREKLKKQADEVLDGIREQEQYLKQYKELLESIDGMSK